MLRPMVVLELVGSNAVVQGWVAEQFGRSKWLLSVLLSFLVLESPWKCGNLCKHLWYNEAYSGSHTEQLYSLLISSSSSLSLSSSLHDLPLNRTVHVSMCGIWYQWVFVGCLYLPLSCDELSSFSALWR